MLETEQKKVQVNKICVDKQLVTANNASTSRVNVSSQHVMTIAASSHQDETELLSMARKPQKKVATAKKAKAEAKKTVVVVEKTPVELPRVVQLRFQGKIKARASTIRSDGTVTKRGSSLNFGFIEVNNKDLKALKDHPLWTPELGEKDVFWHCKDCCYDQEYPDDNRQRAGDIVTFTVGLGRDGSCLQAKQVELKQRASWWHSVAVQEE